MTIEMWADFVVYTIGVFTTGLCCGVFLVERLRGKE